MEGNLLLCILFIRFVVLLLSTDVPRVVRRPSAQQALPLPQRSVAYRIAVVLQKYRMNELRLRFQTKIDGKRNASKL